MVQNHLDMKRSEGSLLAKFSSFTSKVARIRIRAIFPKKDLAKQKTKGSFQIWIRKIFVEIVIFFDFLHQVPGN